MSPKTLKQFALANAVFSLLLAGTTVALWGLFAHVNEATLIALANSQGPDVDAARNLLRLLAFQIKLTMPVAGLAALWLEMSALRLWKYSRQVDTAALTGPVTTVRGPSAGAIRMGALQALLGLVTVVGAASLDKMLAQEEVRSGQPGYLSMVLPSCVLLAGAGSAVFIASLALRGQTIPPRDKWKSMGWNFLCFIGGYCIGDIFVCAL